MIRNLTGSSTREILTLAALHVWPHFYDLVLRDNQSHTWWKNGGSAFYFRFVNNLTESQTAVLTFSVYLPKMLAKNSGIYGKELNNPEVSIDELFVTFVTQIMDSVDMRH